MRGTRKLLTALWAALCAVLCAALCGCAPRLIMNPQDLYALPKLPARFTELSEELSKTLEEGAEYAAPTSGERIQPVQLVDLDGDGREEAVAFFRNTADEKPLKVQVYSVQGESYGLVGKLEGVGTSIYSVDYKDLDGDGDLEIAVGWKASPEMQILEVYSLEPQGPRNLVRTDYVKYAIADLDGDGKQGLVVLRAGAEGESVAEYYSWTEDGGLASRAPARISVTMAELSQQGRLRQGTLRGGEGALFVTGVTDQQTAMTDILTIRDGELVNIVLSEATGVSSVFAPFSSLYPSDINGDGVTEVPRSVALLAPGETEGPYRVVEWCSYDMRGAPAVALRTYHNLDDGWYLQLPDSWRDQFYVSRAVTGGDAVTTFYIRGEYVRGGQQQGAPFLRVTALTGSGRDMRAARGNRFVLNRLAETVYTAELLDANGTWNHGVSEDQVRAAFSLILTEWQAGDN